MQILELDVDAGKINIKFLVSSIKSKLTIKIFLFSSEVTLYLIVSLFYID